MKSVSRQLFRAFNSKRFFTQDVVRMIAMINRDKLIFFSTSIDVFLFVFSLIEKQFQFLIQKFIYQTLSIM